MRLIPIRTAAPSAPPTWPLLSVSARTISSRCFRFWVFSPAKLLSVLPFGLTLLFSALIVSFTIRATSS